MLKATLFLCIITAITFLMDTLAYSLRLVVFRNRQYTLTASTYNLISLVAKMVIVFQMPLLGLLLDVRIKDKVDPIIDFRWILLFAALGTLMGIVVLPWFIPIFTKWVVRIQTTGSVIKSIAPIENPVEKVKEAIRGRTRIRLCKSDMVNLWNQKDTLILHMLITSVFSIGVLSAYYAAWMYPAYQLTIAGFSGVINGFATVAMTLILEPKIAIQTDRVLKGEAEYEQLKTSVLALVFSKLAGVLLAQALIVPAAWFLLWVFKVLVQIK